MIILNLAGLRSITTERMDTPIIVLEGELAAFLFNESGEMLVCHRLGAGGPCGIDIDPCVWHTVVALSEVVVCFEVKPGPFAPMTDKEFASWAPAEGDPRAVEYLEGLAAKALA